MKSFRIPIFILLVTFLLSLYGGSSIRHYAQAWQAQLSLAESAVKRADWGQAQDILADLNDQWQEKQNRLHMLAEHQELDEVETLLRRCSRVSTSSSAGAAPLRRWRMTRSCPPTWQSSPPVWPSWVKTRGFRCGIYYRFQRARRVRIATASVRTGFAMTGCKKCRA